jgi:hypothetical protein
MAAETFAKKNEEYWRYVQYSTAQHSTVGLE